MTLSIGSPAPSFNLPDQTGQLHSLNDYTGRYLLLYFYPKDDTPGCTVEACEIRDAWGDFATHDIAVLGISADSVKSHAAFAAKFTLPFPLLADESKEMIKAYGVLGEKSMFGKKYLGIRRMSFLIDPKGVIVKVYPKVQPATHAAEVLADVQAVSL